MVHLPMDPEVLVETIESTFPTWTRRARTRTAANRKAGQYVSTANIWSEIKNIFVRHQKTKCAYCERKLGDAGIEWDVEHFRPKKKVVEWTAPGFTGIRTGSSDEKGYFLLAFEPENYLASCKPCNSTHKGNFFPIAGQREAMAGSMEETRNERPYLLNPLDRDEQPPESLISFFGVLPRATQGSQADRRRAAITIKVLGLDRPDLEYPRFEKIMNLWNALQSEDSPQEARRQQGRRSVKALTAVGSPMTNCARSFLRLYQSDRDTADEIARIATEYVLSHSQ